MSSLSARPEFTVVCPSPIPDRHWFSVARNAEPHGLHR